MGPPSALFSGEGLIATDLIVPERRHRGGDGLVDTPWNRVMTSGWRSWWRRRGVPQCFALLFGPAVAFGVAEVGLRLFGPGPLAPLLPLPAKSPELEVLVGGQIFRTFDTEIGWVNTPGYRTGIYRNNQAGMRADREYTRRPDPGVTRLSAYGDSFTYCYEVGLADCWTYRLEQTLPRAEVLNAGLAAGSIVRSRLCDQFVERQIQ